MTFIHPTADVSESAVVGHGTKLWHYAQIRQGVRIGSDCVIGKGVYIDFDVSVGNNVKIQNGALIYHGATIEDGVFVGPGVILTNDKMPRAVNKNGTLKKDSDWVVGKTLVKEGASLGAGSIILPGIRIGRYALVGAGCVVTKNVPDHGLVYGVPAMLSGYVCRCGRKLTGFDGNWKCSECGLNYEGLNGD